jgi:hypothetical protein
VRAIARTPEWTSACQAEDPVEAASVVLEKQFLWESEEEGGTWASPQEMLDALAEDALQRHKHHVAGVHGAWLRQIGLASRRASRRVRYAPTDRFLKSLVVTCVERRLEYRMFLSRIYERYGLIIGEHEAREIIEAGVADQEDFSDNARRLEERLGSLGLLERFSDSCAYVENPFAMAGSA